MNNSQYGYQTQNMQWPQYSGMPQYGNMSQYGSTPQYGNMPQYGSVLRYGNMPQYGGMPQYGNIQQGQAPMQWMNTMPMWQQNTANADNTQNTNRDIQNEQDKSGDTETKKLSPADFTASDLTQESLDIILTKFGEDVEDIFDLAPGQEWMFGRAQRVTNAFFLQTYIKIEMELKPSEFRLKLDEVCHKRSNIRTAFAYRGLDKPYQVVLKNRRPELIFIDRSDKTLDQLEEDIEKYRIADRRRGFDLEKDPLFRMTVFSTAKKDNYAVVMSQPHINDDGVSEGLIIKDIFVDYALKGKMPKGMPDMPDMPGMPGMPDISKMPVGSYKTYAQWLEGIDKEAEFKYWEELLKDFRITRLPGRIKSHMDPHLNTQTMIVSMPDGSPIAGLQARYHATINSIAQTAWGIMLHNIYGVHDAVFGTISSGRTSEVSGNEMMTGSFVNTFPVRVQASEGELFEDVVLRVQKQIMISQNKAYCSPDELEERLGLDVPVFDHLLNFHSFAGGGDGGKTPGLPGFAILDMDFYDNLSTGMCLYFKVENGSLVCSFTYDMHSFTDRKIKILADCYRQVFDKLLNDKKGKIKVKDLVSPDISAFIPADHDERQAFEELESFLKDQPLFAGVDDDAISRLAESVKTKSYAEGDIVIRENTVTEGLDIVMDGFTEIYSTNKQGWVNVLKMPGPGKVLNISGILDDKPSFVGVRAFSDNVRILNVPKDAMLDIMARYPMAALNIIKEQDDLVKGYMTLWIDSDA